MASNKPAEIDPKALEQAENLWSNFVKMSKWGIVGVAASLIVMALAFVPFTS